MTSRPVLQLRAKRLVEVLLGLALCLHWTAVPLHLGAHDHLGSPLGHGGDGHSHAGHDHRAGSTPGHGAHEEHAGEHGHRAGRQARDAGRQARHNHGQGDVDHQPHEVGDHLLELAEPPLDCAGPLFVHLPAVGEGWIQPVRVSAPLASMRGTDPRPPPEPRSRIPRAPPHRV